VPIRIARRADQSRSLDPFDCLETWARAPSLRHLLNPVRFDDGDISPRDGLRRQ